MYLIDTNIFLEVLLDQDKSNECVELLKKIKEGRIKATLTDFSIDSIILIMENNKKEWTDIRIFLISLNQYKGLIIYKVSLNDKILATLQMKKYNFKLEDAINLQAMFSNNIKTVISFDKDFDKISIINRAVPRQINQ